MTRTEIEFISKTIAEVEREIKDLKLNQNKFGYDIMLECKENSLKHLNKKLDKYEREYYQ